MPAFILAEIHQPYACFVHIKPAYVLSFTEGMIEYSLSVKDLNLHLVSLACKFEFLSVKIEIS